ncbi:hypothetical protein KKD03_01890 [Patescibacteria group bacterium]|nr:hypothetical protein [Patescibacteria group bacterium]
MIDESKSMQPGVNGVNGANVESSVPEKDLSSIAESLMEARRSTEPSMPWDIIKELAVLIVENHPEIIMVFNNQMQTLLAEANQTLPSGVYDSDVAGRLNPLIIELRSKLKTKSE